MNQTKTSSSQIVSWTFGFVVVLYLAWIAAWILERLLEPNIELMTTAIWQFAYWTTLKLLISVDHDLRHLP